jgi:hypothetical protein
LIIIDKFLIFFYFSKLITAKLAFHKLARHRAELIQTILRPRVANQIAVLIQTVLKTKVAIGITMALGTFAAWEDTVALEPDGTVVIELHSVDQPFKPFRFFCLVDYY